MRFTAPAGAWRSLVAHLLWEQGVAGSNPAAPTIHKMRTCEHVMTARIYKPARTAMQSGQAKTKAWVLDYEPEEPRVVESLMGWTSSNDMKSQVRLHFASREEAVAYCERRGISYQVAETQSQPRRGLSYADNFAFTRRNPWTH
jgi:hypothetical protein